MGMERDTGNKFFFFPCVVRFVCHTLPSHISISQGQHDRKTREKGTVLRSNTVPIIKNDNSLLHLSSKTPSKVYMEIDSDPME